MHALDIILNFFREGGVFLYPIALVWVIGLVIALERFGFVVRVGAGNRNMWSQIQPLLEAAGSARPCRPCPTRKRRSPTSCVTASRASRPRDAATTSRRRWRKVWSR